MARLASMGDPMTPLQIIRHLEEELEGCANPDILLSRSMVRLIVIRLKKLRGREKAIRALKAQIKEMEPYMDRDNTP